MRKCRVKILCVLEKWVHANSGYIHIGHRGIVGNNIQKSNTVSQLEVRKQIAMFEFLVSSTIVSVSYDT